VDEAADHGEEPRRYSTSSAPQANELRHRLAQLDHGGSDERDDIASHGEPETSRTCTAVIVLATEACPD
jgi:hypothetical protein